MLRSPSIRALMSILVAACLLPLAAVLTYTIHRQFDKAAGDARQHVRTLALATAANMGATLAGARQSIELLGERPAIRAFDRNRCDPVFQEHHSLFPQFANVLAIDRAGAPVCSFLPAPRGAALSFAGDEWFRRVAAELKFGVGTPYIGPMSGRMVAVLAAPVFGERRHVLGFVALALDLRKYAPNLASSPLPPRTRVGILRGDGVLVWRNEDPDGSIGQNVGRRDYVRRLLALRDGNLEGAGLDGVTRFYAIAPVGEGDLYAYVGIPIDAEHGQTWRGATVVALAGAALLLLVGALVWLVARRITRPLLALTLASRGARQGLPPQPISGAGSRELSELAGAFNAMVADWQAANGKLRASAAEIADLYENAPCGYHSVDADGRLVRINQTALRWLGYRREDVLGKLRFADLLTPDTRKRYAAQFARMQELGVVRDLELELVRKDGSTLAILLNATALRDEDGRFVLSRSTIVDITERRADEARRLRIESQLQQAQKMEALGRLTGGIAHDFNNILGAILGFARLAQRAAPDPAGKLEHSLERIVQACQRARDMVAKMMLYSRAGVGDTTESVAPAPVVREVLQLLAATLPAGIRLSVALDEVAALDISAMELHQVVMNLIINARDAIGEHGRIDVTLDATMAGGEACAMCGEVISGPYVRLTVGDSGAGIAPELQSRIFDPFFTTKEVGKGTGMGLSVVQGIVRKAGGHVLLRSAPGQGTIFSLLFPARPAGHAATPAPAPEAAATAAVPVARGGRVWVVDDEPFLTDYLEELLRTEGYRVTCFNDPLLALDAFRHAPDADLLVTDQTMPRLDGASMARAMLECKPGLPVILCTGYSDNIDEDGARELGLRRFLLKPVEPDLLLAAIAEELVQPAAAALQQAV